MVVGERPKKKVGVWALEERFQKASEISCLLCGGHTYSGSQFWPSGLSQRHRHEIFSNHSVRVFLYIHHHHGDALRWIQGQIYSDPVLSQAGKE